MPLTSLTPSDPSSVGRYELRGRLGAGGMGVVYLGFESGGEPVALKCLPAGVDPELRRRLRREADVLAAVDHPRVARFVGADTTADRPWIAMQYVAGPSLAESAVPLGSSPLHQLTEGLAEGLAALHRQGLTHRDVKPGNIILTYDGPVLVDLGIAAGADLTSLTAHGMVVGTPEWMAPEQLAGRGSGPATDMWGWAAVSSFAATGRSPFGGGPIEALAHRIRYEQPDLRGVPDWLRPAVTAGLAKEPDARPSARRLSGPDGISTIVLSGGPAAGPPGGRPPTGRTTPVGSGAPPRGPRPTATFTPPPNTPRPNRPPPTNRPPANRPTGNRPPPNRPPTSPGRPDDPGRASTTGRALAIAAAIIVVAAIVVGAVYLLTRKNDGSAQGSGSSPASTPRSTPRPSPSPSSSSRSTKDTPSPDTSSTSFDPNNITKADVTAADACDDCSITGTVGFDHPAWGRSTLVTTQPAQSDGTAYIVVFDADGHVKSRTELRDMDQLRTNDPPTDDTGHLFLVYNPGRYDGVIVLDPVADGFDDFGSLPSGDDVSQAAFYSASTDDTNDDGTLEIDQKVNDCNPDCAGGKTTDVVYHWDGDQYRKGD